MNFQKKKNKTEIAITKSLICIETQIIKRLMKIIIKIIKKKS